MDTSRAQKWVAFAVLWLATVFPSAGANGPAGKQAPVTSKERPVLKFYVHDLVLEKTDSSAVVVAGPGGNVTALGMGTIVVTNDLVTDEPSLTSKALGRFQGFYTFSAVNPPSLQLTNTVVFQSGTIALQGDDQILLPVREVAVVGGTGAFRCVQGYALLRTFGHPEGYSAIIEFETHLFSGVC